MSHIKQSQSVLIVVDVQNGFLPKGNLPVNDGDKVIPIINKIAPLFDNVVLTQDWHPERHLSFAETHQNAKPYDVIELDYGLQVLWPTHCVQNTKDAELAASLSIPHAQLIIRKGFNPCVDSYSAFMEADRKTTTGLSGYLKERNLQHCYICGLATDFCVAWTALDARQFGFTATVIEDACQAIDLNNSLALAWQQMTQAGVARIKSTDLIR